MLKVSGLNRPGLFVVIVALVAAVASSPWA